MEADVTLTGREFHCSLNSTMGKKTDEPWSWKVAKSELACRVPDCGLICWTCNLGLYFRELPHAGKPQCKIVYNILKM